MQIIKIELLHEQALKLIEQLEELKILKVVPKKSDSQISPRKWAGSISRETAGISG